jgi:hypothetical protein
MNGQNKNAIFGREESLAAVAIFKPYNPAGGALGRRTESLAEARAVRYGWHG